MHKGRMVPERGEFQHNRHRGFRLRIAQFVVENPIEANRTILFSTIRRGDNKPVDELDRPLRRQPHTHPEIDNKGTSR